MLLPSYITFIELCNYFIVNCLEIESVGLFKKKKNMKDMSDDLRSYRDVRV